MKKSAKPEFLLLFFVFANLIASLFSIVNFSNRISFSKNYCNASHNGVIAVSNNLNIDCNLQFNFKVDNKNYIFNSSEILNKLQLSANQKKFLTSVSSRAETFDKVSKFLCNDDAIKYCYPEVNYILNIIENENCLEAKKADLIVEKNTCNISFTKSKDGKFLDKENFNKKLINEIKKQKNAINIDLVFKSYKVNDDLKEKMTAKSGFSTNFSTSSDSRKNNIKVALASFDGLILEVGETLSFNKTTGPRTAETGYMPAKIIAGGTFVDGYGGGVCQVSTTLYNACLLAGLEIVEVNSHSLPVSYIEPSFDAMVNVGSSDLKVRNNTDSAIVFTTSSIGDVCKVKIYGLPNKYKITRKSEKTKVIPAEPEIVTTDYKKYGLELAENEEKRLSYAKDGYYSNGYLNYYDKNGVLIETKKIRSNKYNQTKGIIVKRN